MVPFTDTVIWTDPYMAETWLLEAVQRHLGCDQNYSVLLAPFEESLKHFVDDWGKTLKARLDCAQTLLQKIEKDSLAGDLLQEFVRSHKVLEMAMNAGMDPRALTRVQQYHYYNGCRMIPYGNRYDSKIAVYVAFVRRHQTPREILEDTKLPFIVTAPFDKCLEQGIPSHYLARHFPVDTNLSAPERTAAGIRVNLGMEVALKSTNPLRSWAGRMFAQTHFDFLLRQKVSKTSKMPFSQWDLVFPHDERCWHEGALQNQCHGMDFVNLFHERGMRKNEFRWAYLNGKVSGKASQVRRFQKAMAAECRRNPVFFQWIITLCLVGFLGGYKHSKKWPSGERAFQIYKFFADAFDAEGQAKEILMAVIDHDGPETVFVVLMREHMMWQMSFLPATRLMMVDLGWNDLYSRAVGDMDSVRDALDQHGMQWLLHNNQLPMSSGIASVVYHNRPDFLTFLTKHMRHVVKKVYHCTIQVDKENFKIMQRYVRTLVPGSDINLFYLPAFGISLEAVRTVAKLQSMYYEEGASVQSFKDTVSTNIPLDDLIKLACFFSLVIEQYDIHLINIDWADFITCQIAALCTRYGVRSPAELPAVAGLLVITPSMRKVRTQLASDGKANKWGTWHVFHNVATGRLNDIPHPKTSTMHELAIIQGVGRIVELNHFTSSATKSSGGTTDASRYQKTLTRAQRISPLIIAPCCGQWTTHRVSAMRPSPPYYDCGHCDGGASYNAVAPRCKFCWNRGTKFKRVALCELTEDGLFRVLTVNVCDMCSNRRGLDHITGPVFRTDYEESIGLGEISSSMIF